MDFIGTAMGIATIPMALLSLASIVGGLILLSQGDMLPVAGGVIAIGIGIGIAAGLERGVALLDALSWRVLRGRSRAAARPIALVTGALPVGLSLAWGVACFTHVAIGTNAGAVRWLWSYGIATLPWTIYALSIHGDRRTLCGIRAYAAHIAYWLLSIAVIGFGAPLAIGLVVALAPAILPTVVGFLLAVADRDALRNVRI